MPRPKPFRPRSRLVVAASILFASFYVLSPSPVHTCMDTFILEEVVITAERVYWYTEYLDPFGTWYKPSYEPYEIVTDPVSIPAPTATSTPDC